MNMYRYRLRADKSSQKSVHLRVAGPSSSAPERMEGAPWRPLPVPVGPMGSALSSLGRSSAVTGLPCVQTHTLGRDWGLGDVFSTPGTVICVCEL